MAKPAFFRYSVNQMSRFFHDKLGKVFVYSAVSFRQFPLTFLCSEISGWVLHLSVALVQPSPRDERCDEQIVMVLTFCGTVNIAARARIRSTSFFTTWNCQRDLCALYLYYMIAVELSLWSDFCLFDQRSTAHQLAT